MMRYALSVKGGYFIQGARPDMGATMFTTAREDAKHFWTRRGAVEFMRNNVPAVFWPDIEPTRLWKLF